jgi:hypothetical protein
MTDDRWPFNDDRWPWPDATDDHDRRPWPEWPGDRWPMTYTDDRPMTDDRHRWPMTGWPMTDDRWPMTDDRWPMTDDRMTDDRWPMTDDRMTICWWLTGWPDDRCSVSNGPILFRACAIVAVPAVPAPVWHNSSASIPTRPCSASTIRIHHARCKRSWERSRVPTYCHRFQTEVFEPSLESVSVYCRGM